MMDTQEGAQQGRKQLGCRQKSALGSEFGWIPARAPPCPPPHPVIQSPFSALCPRGPLSHSSQQKGHLCPVLVQAVGAAASVNVTV